MAIQHRAGRKPYMQGCTDAPAPTPRDHSSGYRQSLRIKDLSYLAHATAEYLHDERPGVIAAADRGARLFGLAVYRTWHYLYPDERFPTLDGKLHFARWSKALSGTQLYNHMTKDVLERSGTPAEVARRKEAGESEPLAFALLDDWFCRGTTIRRA